MPSVDPIRAACRRDHMPAYRQSGTRKVKDIIWIVLHATEGGSATGVASYFQSSSAGGSTHLVVDDERCERCLSNSTIPWGAPGANGKGFHIEQCGYARWSAVVWFSHWRTLRRAAFKTAQHAKAFGIPPVWVDAAGLHAGKPGITTHAECTKAFGGSHTDPGPAWPRKTFLRLVANYYAEIVDGN